MTRGTETIELGPPSPFRVALVGAGRVGTAIADLLARRGHAVVGVASRTSASAQRAADLLETTTFRLVADDAPDADVVLIGANDHAIPDIIEQLVPIMRAGSVVWHVAGSLGIAPLQPALARGALGCAIHPLQACPSVEAARTNLPGSAWGVTVSPGLERWGHRLVTEELGGAAVVLAEEHRPLWHAASVSTSTGISAVLALGEALLDEIGVIEPQEALRPLVAGTIAHTHSQGGGRKTVTGPVVRAEDEIVIRHREALQRASDDSLAEAYLLAARLVLDRATATSRIDRATSSHMRSLLTMAPERGND